MKSADLIRSGFKKQETPKSKYWPKCSREKLSATVGMASRERVLRKFDVVKKEWADGVPVRELSIDTATAKKWVEDELLPKRKRRIYHKR